MRQMIEHLRRGKLGHLTFDMRGHTSFKGYDGDREKGSTVGELPVLWPRSWRYAKGRHGWPIVVFKLEPDYWMKEEDQDLLFKWFGLPTETMLNRIESSNLFGDQGKARLSLSRSHMTNLWTKALKRMLVAKRKREIYLKGLKMTERISGR